MIQVNELTFSYPKSKHNVFEGLNLQLNENRIYGLLGKNGMGKSTLLYRGSRYLVGIGIYFGKSKKKETFIYNSS